MRRLGIILAILFFIQGLANASEVLFKIKGSYFYPSDKTFQDIYGGGLMFWAEASTEILKNVEMSIEAGYFSKKGELSFTKEETKLRIIPVGGGVRYILPARRLRYYFGLGVNYYRYREANLLGTISYGRLGLAGKAGSFIKVKKKISVDIYLGYSFCKMKPADFRFNIGGAEAGIGIAYQFSKK